MLVSVPERTAPGQSPEFDVMRVRDNFPILNQLVPQAACLPGQRRHHTEPNTVLCSLNSSRVLLLNIHRGVQFPHELPRGSMRTPASTCSSS